MKVRLIIVLYILFICNACREEEPTPAVAPDILKEAYENDFLVGVALNTNQILEIDTAAIKIVNKHFNCITAENDMKWEALSTNEYAYNWSKADLYNAFALKNNYKLIGHTLVWHSQLPQWVRSIRDSAALTDAMLSHIYTVVDKYKGTVHGWDVVNEAFEYNGELRDTVFNKYIGREYIPMAFKAAYEADTSAELYYNDFAMTSPGKRDSVIAMIQNLKERNIRIDAVGMQAHWSLTTPSLNEIENTIISYYNAGVKVMITELDITVLGGRYDDPYPEGLPEGENDKLTKRYKELFELFHKHKDKISRVTVWGVHDGQSWLNYYPISGRTDYPLLFDRDYKAKKCFSAVLDASL